MLNERYSRIRRCRPHRNLDLGSSSRETAFRCETAKKNRLDELEEKYYELTDRLDKEVLTRRQAEAHSWTAGMALKQAIDFIRVVTQWIENGAKPPAPTPPDADKLEASLPPSHNK